MAKSYEQQVAELVDEIDRFLDLTESAAGGARNSLAKGRAGDASIKVSEAVEFSAKAGKAMKKLWELVRRTREHGT